MAEDGEDGGTGLKAEDFNMDQGAAGAAHTYPTEAGQIRKGGHIVIKGRPCKVVNVSTSKTGKHGHAKCNFTAIDIFTGKKLEDIVPSTHTTYAPNVSRQEYTLLDITDEDFMSLMDENGESREDLKVRASAAAATRACARDYPLSACPLRAAGALAPSLPLVITGRAHLSPTSASSLRRVCRFGSRVQMPTFPEELAPDIRKKHEENEGSVVVTIMSAMGEEHVISAKIDTAADK